MANQPILIRDLEDLIFFETALDGKDSVAFDAEGVRMSRTGTATVLSLAVSTGDDVHVFIFDLLADVGSDFHIRVIGTLKRVLEDINIIKIVHDCRQDSDALNTFYGIKLASVFDTSLYNVRVSNLQFRENLNNTLERYNCTINPVRNKPTDHYVTHPTYWADRPLTEEQIEWASGDVASLFELRDKLSLAVQADQSDIIKKASEDSASEFRSLSCHEFVTIETSLIGKVIGKKGVVLHNIEIQSGTSISGRPNGFLVLADTKAKISNAKAMIIKKANQKFKW